MGESEINVICFVELSYVLTLKYLVVSILVPIGNVKLSPPRALTLMTWLPDDTSDWTVNTCVPICRFFPTKIVAVVCWLILIDVVVSVTSLEIVVPDDIDPDTIITHERSGNTPLVIASDNVNLETFSDVVDNKV